MTIESITDSEWLLQHRPHASEEQEEAYLERLSIILEHNPSPTWAQVEYARKRALEDLK
jgi:hypothetical protein